MAPRSRAWPEQWAISPQKGSKLVMLGRTSEQGNQKQDYSETHFNAWRKRASRAKPTKLAGLSEWFAGLRHSYEDIGQM